MNQIYSLMNLFIFLGTVFLAWWLYFVLFKRFRVVLTRKRLFDTRNHLFLLAVDGKLSFDHKAYGMCRKTINGMIRYCHKLSLYRFIFDSILLYYCNRSVIEMYTKEKKAIHETLTDEQARLINECYDTIHFTMLNHLVKTCLPLMILTTSIRGLLKLFKLFNTVRTYIVHIAYPGLIAIDSRAREYGASSVNQNVASMCS